MENRTGKILLTFILFCALAVRCGGQAGVIGQLFVQGEVAESEPDPLLNGLVAYWTFDETSDGSVQVDRSDSIGTITLTDVNTVAAGTGIIGNGADFEATDSTALSASDATAAAVDFNGTAEFTFTGWYRPESKTVTRTIFSKWNTSGDNRQFMLRYNSSTDRFEWFVGNADGTDSVSVSAGSLGSPPSGTWYFFCVRKDATTISIQVNGGTVDSAAHTTDIKDGVTEFEFGRLSPSLGVYGDGIMDEWGAYNRAISDSESAQLYNGGSGYRPL